MCTLLIDVGHEYLLWEGFEGFFFTVMKLWCCAAHISIFLLSLLVSGIPSIFGPFEDSMDYFLGPSGIWLGMGFMILLYFIWMSAHFFDINPNLKLGIWICICSVVSVVIYFSSWLSRSGVGVFWCGDSVERGFWFREGIPRLSGKRETHPSGNEWQFRLQLCDTLSMSVSTSAPVIMNSECGVSSVGTGTSVVVSATACTVEVCVGR